jgi:hypothetical protein
MGITRLDGSGKCTTFAQGFVKPAGLAFDPITGDRYIAEQGTNKIRKVDFAAPVPEPETGFSVMIGVLLVTRSVALRRRISAPAATCALNPVD